MNKPTQAQIDNLPKWARKHIESLERQRETAIRTLNDYLDDQTQSKFSYMDGVCTGEDSGPTPKTRYVQTRDITIVHAGVSLTVSAHYDGFIRVQWEDADRFGFEVAAIPESYQCIHLVSRDNMRHR